MGPGEGHETYTLSDSKEEEQEMGAVSFRKWQVFSFDAEATVPWRPLWFIGLPGTPGESRYQDLALPVIKQAPTETSSWFSARGLAKAWRNTGVHLDNYVFGTGVSQQLAFRKCNPLMRNQKWNFSNKSQEHMVAVWHFVVRDDMESWFSANRVTLTSGILA